MTKSDAAPILLSSSTAVDAAARFFDSQKEKNRVDVKIVVRVKNCFYDLRFFATKVLGKTLIV